MSRPLAVLRPEPGNGATAAAIEADGRRAIRLPLFATRALDWPMPDPTMFDALILTSANALRHGGPALEKLRMLPVHAVGAATAAAAARAGFEVVAIGAEGAETLVATAASGGVRRALHLGGRERTLEAGGIVAKAVAIYASEPVAVASNDVMPLRGAVALVQSPRAGRRLAELVSAAGLDRGTIALAAVSARAAGAAGTGWERVVVAPTPSSEAVIAAALALAD